MLATSLVYRPTCFPHTAWRIQAVRCMRFARPRLGHPRHRPNWQNLCRLIAHTQQVEKQGYPKTAERQNGTFGPQSSPGRRRWPDQLLKRPQLRQTTSETLHLFSNTSLRSNTPRMLSLSPTASPATCSDFNLVEFNQGSAEIGTHGVETRPYLISPQGWSKSTAKTGGTGQKSVELESSMVEFEMMLA